MAITRAELYSINLEYKVIIAEHKLWQRFNALRSGSQSAKERDSVDVLSFYPKPREPFKHDNTLTEQSNRAVQSRTYWENKIDCYSLANRHHYFPLLQRLNLEMQRQNEEFSEVLPQSDALTKELTLQAIHHLELQDPQLGYALQSFIGRILIVKSEQLLAFSSMLSLGLVVIAPKPDWNLYDYMEHLIHEMSHIELYVKQLTDSLVIKGCYLSSPFRQQLRPVNAVFHSIFVLARILTRLKPLANSQVDNISVYSRLSDYQQLLEQSLQPFYQSSLLTPAGKLLFDEIIRINYRNSY